MRLNINLVPKIVLIVLVIFSTAIAGVLYFNLRDVNGLLHEQVLLRLGDEVDKEAAAFRIEGFLKPKGDLELFANSKALRGLYQTIEKGNASRDDLAPWKDRLESLFLAIMQQRPSYHQIRYLYKNGQEEVKLSNVNGKISSVPHNMMHKKAYKPFFKETIELFSEEYFISDIALNDEYDKFSVTNVPVFHVATPVFSDKDDLKGVLVITIRFDTLVSSLAYSPEDMAYFITDSNGKYLFHKDKNKVALWGEGSGKTIKDDFKGVDLLAHNDANMGSSAGRVNLDDLGLGVSFLHIHFDNLDDERSYVLGAITSYNKVNEETAFFTRKLTMFALFMIFLVALVLVFTLQYILRPIRKLTQAAAGIARGNDDEDIPDFGSDEVGQMSKAFKHMVNAKNNAFNELEKSKEVIENLVDGIITIDKDGKLIGLSSVAEEIFGYAEDEMVGEDVSIIIKPKGARRYKDFIRDFFIGENQSERGRTIEAVGVRKNREEFPIEISVGSAEIDNNFVFIGSVRDLTENKTMERMLNGILTSAGDGIYGLDMESRITFANPAACKLLGYSEEELIGMQQHDIICHTCSIEDGSEREHNFYKHFKSGQSFFSVEDSFWKKDKSSFPVRCTSAPIRDTLGKVNGAVVIFRDISEQKESEEELRQAKVEAERSAKVKSEFLARMSHELRTPMNGIIGTASLMEGEDLPEKHRSYVKTIMTSGQSLLAILNEILDFSSIEAGRAEIASAPFNVCESLKSVERLFFPLVTQKGLEFELDCQNVPEFITTDEGRIRQILINFLNNSMRFTDKGKITLSAAVEEDGENIRFAVKDTGVGIPKDKQKKLFRAFSQADDSPLRKSGGTGLGLYICKEYVDLMNGKIGLESVKDLGSTFWFSIPLKIPAEEDLLSFKPDVDEHGITAEYGTYKFNASILLVDDVEVNREVAKEMLESYGCRVDFACNGQEAMDKLEAGNYNLILMDCQMPVMDGFEATEEIRKTNKNIPIVALTANAFAKEKYNCLDVGMNDFVAKPFVRESFYFVLNKWLPNLAVECDYIDEPVVVVDTSKAIEQSAPGVVDFNILEQFGKNKKRVIELTIADAEPRVADIKDAVKDDDYERAQELAHALKSIFGQVGAATISAIAKEIEAKVKTSDLEGVDGLVQELELGYKELKTVLLKCIADMG